MKMNRKLFLIVFCVFAIAMVAAVGMAVAGEDQQTITGKVLKADPGLVLDSDGGEYILTGEDLSKMVGKNVKVTGTISEGEGGKTIDVIDFEEIP